jgi:hypothetical protein
MFFILQCNGFGGPLTDFDCFHPKRPDFSLVQTFLAEAGLLQATSRNTASLDNVLPFGCS